MNVLIVEPDAALGTLWSRHLERSGAQVRLAATRADGFAALRERDVSIIVLDVDLPGHGAFAVADYAQVRRPDAKVIFVTSSSFFSDGSIFRHIPNACAFVGAGTPPEDLAQMALHWGQPRT